MKKINLSVKNRKNCPFIREVNWERDGFTDFTCKLKHQTIKDIDEIPVWCPLPDEN